MANSVLDHREAAERILLGQYRMTTQGKDAELAAADRYEVAAAYLEIAEMLEFLLGQLQMHSPKMNGQHSYRFRGGWPMTHCVGPGREAAVKAAIEEVKRSLKENN